MDILIHNKINNPEIKKGLTDILSGMGDPIFSTPDLIIINSKTFPVIPEDVVKRLQEFLTKKELDIEDVVYIFYPLGNDKLGMWPIKRKGRKRPDPRINTI